MHHSEEAIKYSDPKRYVEVLIKLASYDSERPETVIHSDTPDVNVFNMYRKRGFFGTLVGTLEMGLMFNFIDSPVLVADIKDRLQYWKSKKFIDKPLTDDPDVNDAKYLLAKAIQELKSKYKLDL